LDDISYEALRYFGLLRGAPLGTVLNRQLATFAAMVQKEFPAVRAHVLAVMNAQGHDVEVVEDHVQHVIPF
jgi:hypothetical protein